MRFLSLIAIFSLMVSILGCSSGNSGSSATPDNLPPKKQYKQIEYAGLETPYVIEQGDAGIILFGFLRLMKEAYYGVLSPLYVDNELPVLEYEYDQSDGDCAKGRVDIDEPSNTSIVLTISQCEVAATTLDGHILAEGQVFYDILVNLDGTLAGVESKAKYYSLDTDYDFLEYSFSGGVLDDQVTIDSAVMHSRSSGQYFMVKNFVRKGHESFGDFYISDKGLITFTYNSLSGELIFNGGSEAHLSLTHKMNYFFSPLVKMVDDVVLSYEKNDYAFGALTAEYQNTNLLGYYPYFSSRVPNKTEDKEFKTDRSVTLTISADHMEDENNDILKFDWSIDNEGKRCDGRLIQIDPITVEFFSDCVEEYEVVAMVSDGTGQTYELSMPVSVQPLSPDIDVVEGVKLASGEALSLQLSASNTAMDGPFEYSLVYGPEGISVSKSGLVEGEPRSLINSDKTVFYITVAAENTKRSTLNFTVELENPLDETLLYTGGVHCFSDDLGWWDLSGEGRDQSVCRYLNTFAVSTVEDGKRRIEYVELENIKSDPILDVSISPMDDDIQYEILLAYENEIHVIDGKSYKLERVIQKPAGVSLDIHSAKPVFEPSINQFPGFFLRGDMQGPYRRKTYFYDAVENTFEEIDEYSLALTISELRFSPRTKISRAQFRELFDEDSSGVARISGGFPDELPRVITSNGSVLSVRRIGSSDSIDFEVEGADFHDRGIAFGDFDNSAGVEVVYLNVADNPGTLEVYAMQEDKFNLIREFPVDNSCRFSHRILMRSVSDASLAYAKSYKTTNHSICQYRIDGTHNVLEHSLTPRAIAASNFSSLSSPRVDHEGKVYTFASFTQYPQLMDRVNFDASGNHISTIHTSMRAPYSQADLYYLGVESKYIPDSIFNSRNNPGYIYDINSYLEQSEINRVIESSTPKAEMVLAAPVATSDKQALLFDMITGDEIYVRSFHPVTGDELQRSLFKSEFRFSSRDHKEVFSFDLNQDETDEIFFVHGFERVLGIYHWTDSGMSLLKHFPISLAGNRYDVSAQDINGDGELELILYSPYEDCVEGRDLSKIAILESDLSNLSEIEIPACVSSIPTIDYLQTDEGLKLAQKRNLIVFGKNNYDGRLIRSRATFSLFKEIDLVASKVVATSPIFVGELKPDSMIFLGQDIYKARKVGLFDSGLYFFH